MEAPKTAAVRIIGWALIGLALFDRDRLRRFRPNPLDLAMAAWLAVEAVAALAARSPALAIFGDAEIHEGLLTSLALAGVYLAARLALRSAEAIARTLDVWLAAALIGTLYVFLQVARLDPISWSQTATIGETVRPIGTFGHPNLMGLMTGAAAVIALVRGGIEPRWRALHLAAGLLFAVAAVLSFSRGAWIGLVLGPRRRRVLGVARGRRVDQAPGARRRRGGRAGRGRGGVQRHGRCPCHSTRPAREPGAGIRPRAARDLAHGVGGVHGTAGPRAGAGQLRAGLHPLPDAGVLALRVGQVRRSRALDRHAHTRDPGRPRRARGAGGDGDGGAGGVDRMARRARRARAARGIDRRRDRDRRRRLGSGSIGIAGATLLVVTLAAIANLAAPADARATVRPAGEPVPAARSGSRPKGGKPGPKGATRGPMDARPPAWALGAAVVLGVAMSVVTANQLLASHAAWRARGWLMRGVPATDKETGAIYADEADRLQKAMARALADDDLPRLIAQDLIEWSKAWQDPITLMDGATGAAREAVRRQPLRAVNHRWLALALSALALSGDTTAVSACDSAFADAARLAPVDGAILVEWSRTSIRLRQPAPAVPHIERAVELYPRDARALATLAEAQWALRDTTAALASAERALAAEWYGDSAAQASARGWVARVRALRPESP